MSNNGLKFAGALILAGVCFFLFKKSRAPAPNKVMPAKVSASTTAPVAPSGQTLIDPEPAQRVSAIQEARRAFTRMASLGIQIIPTQKRRDKLDMKLAINTPSAGCGLGEFDLIKNVSRNLSDKLFVLTLENPEKPGTPLFTKRISAFDISERALVTVNVPAFEDKGQGLAVFLCADSGKENSCGSKKPLKAADWQKQMTEKKTHDFLFYTQFIVIKGGVAYLVPTHKWDDKSLDAVQESLKPVLTNTSAFDAFKSKLQILTPVPARIQSGALTLNLPARDPGC